MTVMNNPKLAIKRGDVILVLFPNSDLITLKKRSALVIQKDDLQTGLPQIVVAIITTNMDRADHQNRVPIYTSTPTGIQSGLDRDSMVRTDNLATIHENAIFKVLGTLPMQNINVALRHTLNL